ncbi:hypothetical protein NLI96_g1273 [Meripilus lineatus]|uniref:Uncharacterized protein n=1 Tax=Meripilus lineatus TaxID=2056292 RepID=A0AAD5VAX6_9APHY|nr:hypothetical protein NLI96_g1273 [Physisporinus lineatus]
MTLSLDLESKNRTISVWVCFRSHGVLVNSEFDYIQSFPTSSNLEAIPAFNEDRQYFQVRLLILSLTDTQLSIDACSDSMSPPQVLSAVWNGDSETSISHSTRPVLPYDIQKLVINSFPSEGEWLESRTLVNCALTCTDWHFLVTPILYNRIEVAGKTRYQHLEASLKKRELATHIKVLSLHDITPVERMSHVALHTLPPRVINLDELFIFGPYSSESTVRVFPYRQSLLANLPRFQSVHHVYFHQIQVDSLQEIRRVLGSLYSVDSAVFRSVTWKTPAPVPFKPLFNATSWRLSQFSLQGCTSDFIAPVFWAMPPQNASEPSQLRTIARSSGCHPPLCEPDVLPVAELAKFILELPDDMVGSICWEWNNPAGSSSWYLECCIDELSDRYPTYVRFRLSNQHPFPDPTTIPNFRITHIEISREEQTGLDAKCLDALLEDFQCLECLDLRFQQLAEPNPILQTIAQQLPNTRKSRVGIYVNGSFHGPPGTQPFSQPRFTTGTRTQPGLCEQTKTRLASQRKRLAQSLHILAARIQKENIPDGYMSVMKQLIAIRRELIKAKEKIDKILINDCLAVMGNCLIALERHEDALRYSLEIVELNRILVAEEPTRYSGSLIVFLSIAISGLYELGRHEEALKFSLEWVEISRAPATGNPRDLSKALSWAVGSLQKLGRHQEAMKYCLEWVEITRTLAHDNPSETHDYLALSLSTAARCLHGLGRHEEALKYSLETDGINQVSTT